MNDAAPQTARLDVEDLLESATRETGLVDFGAPDVRGPLTILIDSLNREAELTPAGIEGQRATLNRTLVNRLRIQEQLRRHPHILEEEIQGPIVIVGLPRSGTTKLQRMMGADPGLQKLPLWRLMNPAPYPGVSAGGRDPRIAYAEGVVQQMAAASPKFFAAHPMAAEEPDEEIFMMLMTLVSSIPMHGAHTPSYRRWMTRQDCASWYRQLRSLLQFMQWQDGSRPRPWLLKAPWHFRWIRTLFDVFPGASIVHCYRDPAETVASMAGLFEQTRKMASERDAPHEIGRLVLEYWSDAVGTFLTERRALSLEKRFLDVQYAEIVTDPLAVIERVYRTAHVALTPEAVAGMQNWDRANPKDKHGVHRYSLERYGISDAHIDTYFGEYRSQFATAGG